MRTVINDQVFKSKINNIPEDVAHLFSNIFQVSCAKMGKEHSLGGERSRLTRPPETHPVSVGMLKAEGSGRLPCLLGHSLISTLFL